MNEPECGSRHPAVHDLMVPTSTFSLSQYAGLCRQRIDAALARCLAMEEGCPPALLDAMRYALLAPGKRLRPMLVLLGAEACGDESDRPLPAACAVEMVHAYSLVHDDLPAMDDDDLRRGRPTCHKVYGEAMAILAGDALLTLAFETLAQLEPAELAGRCTAILARAAGASQLVGGQADDITRSLVGDGLVGLEAIHCRKTGAMIAASLELGAVVAGADQRQVDALRQYGRAIGLAFQIADDLLDVRGDQATMGKRVRKDSDLGKLTYPGLLGVEASVERAEQLIAEACHLAAAFGGRAGGLQAVARFVLQRNC